MISPVGHINNDFQGSEYVVAEKSSGIAWLKLSNTGSISENPLIINSPNGGIKVYFETNTSTSIRFHNVFFYKKDTDEGKGGRVKVYFRQKDKQTFVLKYFYVNNSPIGQQNVTLGVEFNIRDKVPQIDGSNRRIFVGWNTKIDGSGDFYNEKQTIMPNEYFLSTLDDQQRLFAIFDEQIVITRPHTGWAYSNIYWDGTKLTFIDEYLLDANDNEIPESEYNKIEQ